MKFKNFSLLFFCIYTVSFTHQHLSFFFFSGVSPTGTQTSDSRHDEMSTAVCFPSSQNYDSTKKLQPLKFDTEKKTNNSFLISSQDFPRRTSGDDLRKQRHNLCSSSSPEDDIDTGDAELSEMERRILSLSHRKSQLRKQDTNACLIAPPEFKIAEYFPG